jgi:hypothetical protein
MCELAGWCSLPQEAQAAWAQALLSVMAIIAAGLFPVWHSKREVGRSVGSIVALMAYVSDTADGLVARLAQVEGSNGASNWDASAWRRLLNAMDAMAIHQLPDEGLVHPVLMARECVADIAVDYLNTIERAQSLQPPGKFEIERIQSRSAAIAQHYGACVEVDRAHRPLGSLTRIKLWRKKKATDANGRSVS